MTLEDRLKTLCRLNANSAFINKDLYRTLYKEDFFILAYERLKTNQGAMTSGISHKGNVDGVNMDMVRQTILELKNESYQPSPSRRTYIPKANGKLRPLGMPDFRDKLVQECVSIILNCIYDSPDNPTFSKDSFGFRQGRGCHHALKQGHRTFKGVIWVIKADVKSFFDNVDHHILMNLLKKRIQDERFLRLVWKFLRCGYMENGQLVNPLKGTPQGGNLSPILSNIYLHEFDLFVEELKIKHGAKTKRCPIYQNAASQHKQARRRFRISRKATDSLFEFKKAEMNRLRKIQLNLPSARVINPDKASISYLRYADDWVLGLKCTKQKADFIYARCEEFFKEKLNLEWSKEKSLLVRSTEKDIEFLGVYMSFVTKRQQRLSTRKTHKGVIETRRTVPMNDMKYVMSKEDVCHSLQTKGFLDGNFNPISCKRLVNLETYEIAKIYQSTIRGIANYYGFVHNIETLNFIHYLLFMSLCKTLAQKLKTVKRKIMTKYGGKTLTIEGRGNAKPIVITSCGGYTRDLERFNINMTDDVIHFPGFHQNNTASWLKLNKCCLCKKEGYIEMHHVRHIRKIGASVKGFDLVLQKLNRKQIPVCLKCHQDIHKGLYDGANLKEVAESVMKELGIKKWEDKTPPRPKK
jgi:group II intron reverse transcriptase/maturase